MAQGELEWGSLSESDFYIVRGSFLSIHLTKFLFVASLTWDQEMKNKAILDLAEFTAHWGRQTLKWSH